MRWNHLAILALVSIAGCTGATATVDCGGGTYSQTDTGRYCAYGVIAGGFTCPADLPFSYDVGLPDGDLGLVCSDFEGGGPFPAKVCTDLGAPEECEGTPHFDPMARSLLPEPTPQCAPAFPPDPTPGSLGGIHVGRYGAEYGTPLDELSDGDNVQVYQDADGNPALALALQISDDGDTFQCFRVTIRNTFPDETVSEAIPGQYISEQGGRIAGVLDQLGPRTGSLDGQEVTLDIDVQYADVVETRTITLVLSDP